MAILHGNATKVRPGRLLRRDYTSIGHLVRACGEIEDLISWYLFALAKVNYSNGLILIGKLPASARLKLAKKLAKPKEARLLKQHFDDAGYDEIVFVRNAVSHGVFVGVDDGGNYLFELSNWVVDDGDERRDELGIIVATFASEYLAHVAAKAEALLAPLEKGLELEASREKHRPQALSAHPKARDQEKRQAAPSRQRKA